MFNPFTPGGTIPLAVTEASARVALTKSGYPPKTLEIQSIPAGAIAFLAFTAGMALDATFSFIVVNNAP